MSTTINKKFPHKKFLSENCEILSRYPVPDLLQKRILGFEELEEHLENTEDEDKQELLNRLEDLSLELDEELEEFYEDLLDNNEQPEEESEVMTAMPPASPAATTQKQEVVMATVTETPTLKANAQSSPGIKNSDEGILEQLVKARTTSVMPEKLLALGFKTPLGGRSIQVGHYLLYRGKYSLYYSIIKNS